MKLVGTCKVERQGLPAQAQIEFDLGAQTISIWLPTPDIKDYVTAAQRLSGKDPLIRNIRVVSPAGELKCPRLPVCFVSSVNSAGWSLDDGEINKFIALGDGRVQGIRLGLTLRRSTMTFTIFPFAGSTTLDFETVFTNHGDNNHVQFPIHLGKRRINVRYSPNYVFVRGPIDVIERECARHVCSALSLGPEQVVAQLVPSRLTINYSWAKCKTYGETVVKSDDLPRAFQILVDLLTKSTESERERRVNEIIHLVGGFQQQSYVEYRLTNLLKALESFDGTSTMDANHLAVLLQITREEADFICGIRNCMFHHAMSLMDAARKTHSDLSNRRASLGRFTRLRVSDELPWRLYVTFARLIVSAFFRSCGINNTKVIFSTMKGI